MAEDLQNLDGTEYYDYIILDGTKLTPNRVKGSIEATRKKFFDLEITAVPIISESQRLMRAQKLSLSEEEIYQLDNSPYILTRGASGEKRFLTEFDYYSALIRAGEDNANTVARLKRTIIYRYSQVKQMYWTVYDNSFHIYGKEQMGKSEAERRAWFHHKYVALYDIKTMYEDFLDEIDIELERWESFVKAASRQLSSTEMSYQATGRFYNHKAGKYIIDGE